MQIFLQSGLQIVGHLKHEFCGRTAFAQLNAADSARIISGVMASCFWAVTTYSANMGLINNYILPVIGKTDVSSVNNHFVEKFYRTLSNMPAVDGANNKKAREMFLQTQSLKYIRFSEAVFVKL